MNTIPKLFLNPTWDGIMALSRGEQIELAMFAVVSILWIGGLIIGGWLMVRRKRREQD